MLQYHDESGGGRGMRAGRVSVVSESARRQRIGSHNVAQKLQLAAWLANPVVTAEALMQIWRF